MPQEDYVKVQGEKVYELPPLLVRPMIPTTNIELLKRLVGRQQKAERLTKFDDYPLESLPDKQMLEMCWAYSKFIACWRIAWTHGSVGLVRSGVLPPPGSA